MRTMQVYAVSVYVEAEKAARELGVRSRGGFFDDGRDEDYATALVDGAFAKALVIRLVRKVEGRQFYEARAPPHAGSMCCTGTRRESRLTCILRHCSESSTISRGVSASV